MALAASGPPPALRSLLPVLEQYGIVTAAELDPESLAARCRAEVAHTGIPFMYDPRGHGVGPQAAWESDSCREARERRVRYGR